MTNLRITLASWAPFVAGAEVAVERLALGLVGAGHEVLLVVGTDGEALGRFREAGLECVHVPQRFTDKWGWLRYRRSRAGLERVLREFRPDVVHSNDLPTSQMVSDAARRLGIPTVCHHRWIFEGPAIDWLNKYDSDRHLFVSRALMEDLCGKSPRLAARPRAVVYDGLPLPDPPSEGDRERAKRHLGLSPERATVLFAGQVVEHKGVADLLHAWALSRQWHRRAELVVVGDDLKGEGRYRREMEALASELGCPTRFLGFRTDVMDCFAAADVAVVPSHSEPLGLVALEAMASCRPVVGCRVGGIRETIVDGETGVLVPPREPERLAAAIDELLGDTKLRDRLGRAARERCEEMFSLEAHVQAVLEQYEHVLSKKGIVAV